MRRALAAFALLLGLCARAQDFVRLKPLTKDLDVPLVPQERKDKWGYVNDKGKFIIRNVFDAAGEFITYQSSDGAPFTCAVVKSEGKWGVLRRDASYFVEPVLDTVILRRDNDFAIVVKNGRYGLMRFDEASFDPFVIPTVYVRIDTLKRYGGYFLRSSTHSGYCDEFGSTVIRVSCKGLEESGQFLKATSDAGFTGLLTRTGEEILPTVFRSITEGPDNRYLVVESADGKFGCYSNSGDEVIPAVLDAPPVNEVRFKTAGGARIEFSQSDFPHEFYAYEKDRNGYVMRFVLPLTSLGAAFAGHSEVTEVTLPDCILNYCPGEFKDCPSLEKVNLLRGITEIPEGMFEGCKFLESITLPDGILRVPARMFKDCEFLDRIELPASVGEIAAEAFAGCVNLETVSSRGFIYNIGECAFSGCIRLRALPRLNSLRELGSGAFQNCTMLDRFIIPEDISAIAPDTFRGCDNLSEVFFPASLTAIGDSAFKGCYMMREVSLPQGMRTVGAMAFCNTGLVDVTLPESVESVGERAFEILSLRTASLDWKFNDCVATIFGSIIPEITWRGQPEPEPDPELLPEAEPEFVPEAEPELDPEAVPEAEHVSEPVSTDHP